MEPPAKQAKNSADAVRSKVRGPGCLANGTKVAVRPVARFGPLRRADRNRGTAALELRPGAGLR